jgi:lipoprotein-releasing system permease protein
MLGVATLIVVNSVMGGFATKLRDRMRGIQAHILIESRSHDGFYDCAGKIRQVQKLVGDKLEAITPVIESFAMLQFRGKRYDRNGELLSEGEAFSRPVRLIGIDPVGKSQTGEFARFLQDSDNRQQPAGCFDLKGKAEDWHKKNYSPVAEEPSPRPMRWVDPDGPPPTDPPELPAEKIFGAVVGYGIAMYRDPNAKSSDPNKDIPLLKPGDEIILTTVSRNETEGHDGRKGFARPVLFKCVVTDLVKFEMSEYDSNLIFLDLGTMQQLRTMHNRATSLHLKLKDYDRDAREVVEVLSRAENFHPYLYQVQTWEHKQGPLLAAISIERGILNVLLFLIIAVAGFGILAIFFMIVVEKTRDIGILKALGASNGGVMGIFLSYGLTLGLVGAGLGTVLGISITAYVNEIEQFLARLTGEDVFPRDVYYFDRIPTDMQMASVLLVNLGAVLIAVGASVFPSLRAALLHPVRALRYE